MLATTVNSKRRAALLAMLSANRGELDPEKLRKVLAILAIPQNAA